MRYFFAPSALFDALRAQVMQSLGQPNGGSDQPWDEGITTLALSPHEYTPPQYAAMIDYALANGGTEITEEEYRAANNTILDEDTAPVPPEPEQAE